MKVCASSSGNLKPEVLLTPFGEHEGVEISRISLQIRRKEIYAKLADEGGQRLVALEELGEEIA